MPVGAGPPDPLLLADEMLLTRSGSAAELQAELARALETRGFACVSYRTERDWRVAFVARGAAALPDPERDTRLSRPSVHESAAPEHGHCDELARSGVFLLLLTNEPERAREVPCVELPELGSVESFCEVLGALGEAARRCDLATLVLRGYPPPVNERVAWTTVTPDPAVVEVNMAPYATIAEFLERNRACYEAARATGLEPYRLYYNGAVGDSGGAGQITFGGPTPLRSPFFVVPELLPRFVSYAVEHPSLSYSFAHDYVGASGQSVRPDERDPDALAELRLALELLERTPALDPATLWLSLAPCLTDAAGNSHRCEINVEKLWNPFQPGRGQLGLVEFRAFRMQHTPERAAALAALFRAVLARLMTRPYPASFVDWGAALHDRFALPFYLKQDLAVVLADLEAAGVALPEPLALELEPTPWRDFAELEFAGCTLTIRRALEFWPLIGDATWQQGTSRLVDSSTARLELTLRPAESSSLAFDAWQLRANDMPLPLRAERDALGPARVFGVRYRRFAPRPGFHPTLGVQDPVRLLLSHPEHASALEISLHEWRPDKAAYACLPVDHDDARARRAERCRVREIELRNLGPARAAPRAALRDYSLDLRYPLSAR